MEKIEVSNEQLTLDIFNSKKEMEAYKKIYEGFLALSELPEVDTYTANRYYDNYTKYKAFYNSCNEFLSDLYHLEFQRKSKNTLDKI